MNLVIMKGRLTADIELHTTQTDKTMASFRMAIGHKDKVQFFSFTAWENTAKFLSQYCRKGSEIMVQGELQNRVSEKDGKKSYFTDIIVRNVELCGKKENTDNE